MGAIRPCQCAGRRKGWGFRCCVRRTLVGECGKDDGGVRVGEGCWWWGEGPRCGGTGGSRTARTRFGESGKRLGFGWGVRRAAPLWIPAFAGTTMGGCGAAGGVGGGASFECPQDRLRQAQGERTRGARVRWGVRDAMGGTEAPRAAPLPWIPAFAGTTIGGVCGKDDGGCGGRRGLMEAVGGGPAAAGRAVREPPLRRGVGDATGVWVGARRGVGVGA